MSVGRDGRYKGAVDPDLVPQQRGRSKVKDTRRWCKGKEGREHVVEVRIRPAAGGVTRRCGLLWGGSRWFCFHAKVCVNCEKVLVFTLAEACPDRPVP